MNNKILIFTTLSLFILLSGVALAQEGNPVSEQAQQNQVQQQIQVEDDDDDVGVQVQNQNQVQNKGEETKVQNKEQESAQENKNNGSEMANERRSEVANAVQKMLQVADRSGGIGEQVRVIAQNQEENQEELEVSLEKIQKRGGFVKFLIGPKYGEINNARKMLEQNKLEIQELNELKDQLTNQAEQDALAEQIEVLEEVNLEIENSLNTGQKGASMFGWMFKLFSK